MMLYGQRQSRSFKVKIEMRKLNLKRVNMMCRHLYMTIIEQCWCFMQMNIANYEMGCFTWRCFIDINIIVIINTDY